MGRRKSSPRPRKALLRIDTLADLSAIRAAGDATSPESFRIEGASEGFELLADAGGDEGKPKLKKFAMVAYTGGAMNVGFGMPVVVDLEGMTVLRQANPILLGHDVGQLVGHTDKVDKSAQRLKVSGVISGVGAAAQEVTATATNGFPWQASIGCSVQQREYVDAGKTVNVNGRNFTGPLMVARKSVLGEVSFVPIGADQNTSATVAAQQQKEGTDVNFEQWLKARNYDPAKLTEAEKTLLRGAFDAEAKLAAAGGTVTPPAKSPKEYAAELEAELEAAAKRVRDKTITANAAEDERQAEIRLRAQKHGVDEVEIDGADGKKVKVSLIAHAIKNNWTPDQAELHALRAARPIVPGGLGYSTNQPELNEVVLEAALLQASRHDFRLEDESFYFDRHGDHTVRRVPERIQRETQRELKARYTDQAQQSAHTLFRGHLSPKQFLVAAFRANGHRRDLDLSGESGIRASLAMWDHMEKQRLVAEGSSNISISNVLANVMNKFALQGYLYVEQTWRKICAVKPVNDFKASKSINLLGDVMFKQLGPSGELANFSLGDQAFSNQAAPFGGILTIPWTHLVNDDLGILTGVPRKVGQGAGLALNDQIWTLWKAMAAGTVNGDDGNPFWRTTNSAVAGKAYKPNKISGAGSALSSAALKAAKAAFDNQVDPNGNPLGFDGSMPLLLHGPSLWQTARELLTFKELVGTGQTADARQPNGNVWAGTMEPVMSRYVENAAYGNTTTGWWILFNPEGLAVIEVVFLNGVDTPAVLQAGPDYQFDRLGISIRGTMPFGSNPQNFRGGVYNVGA
jgi:hypothetical protein